MIRAILAGEKTQTRRVVRWRPVSPADVSATRQPDETGVTYDGQWLGIWREKTGDSVGYTPCPFGAAGDRLWVRETWAPGARGLIPIYYRADHPDIEAAGEKDLLEDGRWRPSIYMRREDSRITLEVTEVRCQRLQDITDADIEAEGIHHHPAAAAILDSSMWTWRAAWTAGWDAINGRRPGCDWASNPWVFAVSFRRLPC